jgi:hypothetical protein
MKITAFELRKILKAEIDKAKIYFLRSLLMMEVEDPSETSKTES